MTTAARTSALVSVVVVALASVFAPTLFDEASAQRVVAMLFDEASAQRVVATLFGRADRNLNASLTLINGIAAAANGSVSFADLEYLVDLEDFVWSFKPATVGTTANWEGMQAGQAAIFGSVGGFEYLKVNIRNEHPPVATRDAVVLFVTTEGQSVNNGPYGGDAVFSFRFSNAGKIVFMEEFLDSLYISGYFPPPPASQLGLASQLGFRAHFLAEQ